MYFLKEVIEDYRKYAIELNKKDSIDILDNAKLREYILNKIDSLN